MKEKWKDIIGYDGYKISNYGRVRLLRGKITTGWDKGGGYKKVKLYSGRDYKNKAIHRLVAIYFIDNPDNKNIINHLDSNPSNNFVENLEWCNQKENMRHAVEKGRMRGAPRLVLNKESGIFYESVIEAAKTISKKPSWLVTRLMGRTINKTEFIYA